MVRERIRETARRDACEPAPLASDAVRLARLAASIHMTQAAGLLEHARSDEPDSRGASE